MDNVRESVKTVVGKVESIIADMVEEMPYHLSESVKPYLAIAMKMYAQDRVMAAANLIKNYETLVDTYDCINPRNEELALAVIGVLTEE